MRSSRAPMSCPQCTRRLLEAAFSPITAKQGLRASTALIQQQQAATWRRKQFSTSTSKQRAKSAASSFQPSRPAQPSFAVMMSQGQEKAQRQGQNMMTESVGLLPDTFILPTGPTRWTWQVQWHWIKGRATDLMLYVFMRWLYRGNGIKYEKSKVKRTAMEMYTSMYKAFAAGNIEPVRGMLSSGLASSLQDRIGRRPPTEFLDWSIESTPSKPKLVSYRAMVTPTSNNTENKSRPGLIQAVVRIHTVQRLQKMHKVVEKQGSGKNSPRSVQSVRQNAEPTQKESVEYVVLNKTIADGKASPWKIWGMTQESTLEDIAKSKELKTRAKLQRQ